MDYPIDPDVAEMIRKENDISLSSRHHDKITDKEAL
jgi:hypothetical protein